MSTVHDTRTARDTARTGRDGTRTGAGDGRGPGELLRDLVGNMTDLFRDEIALARKEIGGKVGQATNGIVSLVIGAVIALAGLVVFLEAMGELLAIYLVPQGLPAWAGPAIVGGVVLLIGLILLLKGRSNLKPANLAPTRSADQLRQTGDLVREKL